jgi:hypothetical protein
MPTEAGAGEEGTVTDFFARMNAECVDYALLRNHERYPHFGHDIDLIVRWSDLPRWRSIARSCAADHGWSALTECDHWAQSGSREHAIHILRFYSMSPPKYLQIDAFHSFPLLGLPLVDEDALLRERVWDGRGFYRIDERLENFFRLFQIARLAGYSGTEERLKKYGRRALRFWDESGDLRDFGAGMGMPDLASVLEPLRKDDFRCFKRRVDRQKRRWWIRKMITRPWHGSKLIVDRFADYLRLFWLRPCGFTVRAFAPSEEQRDRMEEIGKRLVRANLVAEFSVGGSRKVRRRVLERGGIVLAWAPAERAEVTLDAAVSDERVIAQLLTLVLERHPRILDRRKDGTENPVLR